MGRKRKYRNAAEKQKAYRDRENQQEQEVQIALTVLAIVKAQNVTLQNTVDYHRCKGKEPELYRPKSGTYAQLFAGRSLIGSVETIQVEYLLLIGALVEARNDWAGTYYTFKTEEKLAHER